MAISSADQHDPRGRQQIGTSPNQGGNNTPQETGSTQEIKKNKNGFRGIKISFKSPRYVPCAYCISSI